MIFTFFVVCLVIFLIIKKVSDDYTERLEKIVTSYSNSPLPTFDIESETNSILKIFKRVDTKNQRGEYHAVVQKSREEAKTINESLNKRCSWCRHRLVVRVNHITGDKFLGCSKFPQCKFTKPLE